MNQRNVGVVLTSLGIAILIYAFKMGVSIKNSNVVNLHMLSERQNTLILGSIVFLAGIILFAVSRPKQAQDNNLPPVWRRVQAFFVAENDNLVGRIVAGLFVGCYLWLLIKTIAFTVISRLFIKDQVLEAIDFANYIETYSVSFLVASLAYSLRSIPSSKVLVHLLGLATIVITISTIIVLVTSDLGSIKWWGMAYFFLIPLAVSCLGIWVVKSRQSQNRSQ